PKDLGDHHRRRQEPGSECRQLRASADIPCAAPRADSRSYTRPLPPLRGHRALLARGSAPSGAEKGPARAGIKPNAGRRRELPTISAEFNEASYLYPFWQNYPPDKRGRAPKGDQFPWIEVGEHSLGAKLSRYLADSFSISDYGLHTGADQRLFLRSKAIS